MAWVEVARSSSLGDLESLIGDIELVKGDRMKVVIETSVPWIFNVAGAEHAFSPFVPDGMDLIDVYSDGSTGVVELEADPVWLASALSFIAANWQGIAIAGLILAGIVLAVVVLIKTTSAVTGVPNMVWIIGVGALAFLLISSKTGGYNRE